MNAFTIKDLENLSGIKAHTIRIWEQRYSFLKPQRTDTNIRYYSSHELKTVLNISLLNKYGYKISHIDRMSEAEMKEKILSLSQAQAQQERIINELIQHMVDLDLDAFEMLLDNFILARGIEKTITFIIFPFLERIGILWVTNHINPAQEHLVTNIIRQKLITGIESASTHLSVNKSVLLFLPEGEHHELGLLFMHYMLKSRGVKVLYVGANVPLNDIEFVAKLKKPDFLYSHLTSVALNFNFEKYLSKISTRLPDQPIIISGQLAQHYKKKVPPKISLKKSLHEVMEYVAALA
ncbi:MerR family transcriptional regulator [Panacibacter ginsenosidivorans]|uniref:MerR family transcriptional regulator n=1 Tax=Panacibacter ginsenosidivorans TaxID=1813871 RepID=A0A5B8V916_9BACT|nr:MerR family transcriptional regulator [Panacibacter ginsenosidivorans]QEC68010.1 MerR family transcriptional regulator [Panacibacter ginsenosidivorans]